MSIDTKLLEEEFGPKEESKEKLIQPLEECEHCPLVDILPEKKRMVGILYDKVDDDEDHPDRLMVEEVCGKGITKLCYMKYAAERFGISGFMFAQSAAMRTYQFDLHIERNKGKPKEGIEGISFNDACIDWGTKREDILDTDGNHRGSYAQRFRDIWNISMNGKGIPTLTEDGMYEIVMSGQEDYDLHIKSQKRLNVQRNLRREYGANYPKHESKD